MLRQNIFFISEYVFQHFPTITTWVLDMYPEMNNQDSGCSEEKQGNTQAAPWKGSFTLRLLKEMEYNFT